MEINEWKPAEGWKEYNLGKSGKVSPMAAAVFGAFMCAFPMIYLLATLADLG